MGQPNDEQKALLLRYAENMRDHPEEWEWACVNGGSGGGFGFDEARKGKIHVRASGCGGLDYLIGHASVDGLHWGPEHQGPSQDLFAANVDRVRIAQRERARREEERRLTAALLEGLPGTIGWARLRMMSSGLLPGLIVGAWMAAVVWAIYWLLKG